MKTWASLILEPKDQFEGGKKKVVLTVGQMTYPFIFTIKKEKKKSLSHNLFSNRMWNVVHLNNNYPYVEIYTILKYAPYMIPK